MLGQGLRRLVIDANIAHSAGNTEHPISSACRVFLDTVLSVGHHVVMTQTISQEWRSHMSAYSRRWLTQMYGRKRVRRVQGECNEIFRRRIYRNAPEHQWKIIVKDVHLIEAAIMTDQVITSQDESARTTFRSVSDAVGELRLIAWVNPTQKKETPLDWLRSGARAEKNRQLGTWFND